jgi:murein DD-endopeptidase MepM/ murein hydrolase activator NlpD
VSAPSIPAIAPEGAATAARPDDARRAARMFEALFLQTLVQRMRESQLEDGFFGSSSGASVYEGMFEQFLGDELASRSPLGIARLLEEHWGGAATEDHASSEVERIAAAERAGRAYRAAMDGIAVGVGATRGETTAPSLDRRPGAPVDPQALAATAAPRPASPATGMGAVGHRPAELPAPESQVRTTGPVSRSFGWGVDPIDGSHRFHGGVDLPAPAGTPVRAVAPGRVASVAEEGGYGLRVVVEHAGGWSTTYSHLSGADVTPGQRVGRGDRLGSVGNSGRSTGPHLHFEALRDGVKVDPGRAAPGPLPPQVFGIRVDETGRR